MLPRIPGDDRPADQVLFERISARPAPHCPRFLSGGNLVAGPQGVALSTSQVLVKSSRAAVRKSSAASSTAAAVSASADG